MRRVQAADPGWAPVGECTRRWNRSDCAHFLNTANCRTGPRSFRAVCRDNEEGHALFAQSAGGARVLLAAL